MSLFECTYFTLTVANRFMIAGTTTTINLRRAKRLEEIEAEKIRVDAEKAAAEE